MNIIQELIDMGAPMAVVLTAEKATEMGLRAFKFTSPLRLLTEPPSLGFVDVPKELQEEMKRAGWHMWKVRVSNSVNAYWDGL